MVDFSKFGHMAIGNIAYWVVSYVHNYYIRICYIFLSAVVIVDALHIAYIELIIEIIIINLIILTS